jgi:hypothetical protein
VQVLEFQYTPVPRAQVAIWVEDAAGRFLATVALTEAVAFRGIGNRPGASQMNSVYRWPYGRREGVLPIWAYSRAGAEGAKLFPRVIFQERSEGEASRSIDDQSPDEYYCLQFTVARSSRDELDAVSCATQFNSDKGRYLNAADVERGYSEPFLERDGSGAMRTLPQMSVYPPRMDVTRCVTPDCFDHPEVDRFAADARAAMPEIDAVTRATPPGDTLQRLLFSVPATWAAGDYVAYIEVNVEGDYNERWSADAYPTPKVPEGRGVWDGFAIGYGYPYRGQPSIVYALPFRLGDAARTSFATAQPAGRSSWDYWNENYGALEAVSMLPSDPAAMTDRDGSGADRLRRDANGQRFAVQVKTVDASEVPVTPPVGEPGMEQPTTPPGPEPVGAVTNLSVRTHENALRSHSWVRISFGAARSERPIHSYDVRVATEPIVDAESFIRNGRPAKNATDDAEGATALMLPISVPEGGLIEAAIGDLVAQTHYYVAARATDELNRSGPIRVVEVDTTARTFATVTPCFIATAAYGTPLAREISVLRGVRDRYLESNALGRELVAAYYRFGPAAAEVVARHPWLQALVRTALTQLTAAVSSLKPTAAG